MKRSPTNLTSGCHPAVSKIGLTTGRDEDQYQNFSSGTADPFANLIGKFSARWLCV